MFITFGDEVEKIWKQRFTGATVLWFMVSSAFNLLYSLLTICLF